MAKARREIKLVGHQFLDGPNVYANHSVLVARVRFGDLAAVMRRDMPNPRPALDGLTSQRGGAAAAAAEAVRAAYSLLSPDAKWTDFALALAGVLQLRYVIAPRGGRVLSAKDGIVTVVVPADDARIGHTAWSLSLMGTLALISGDWSRFPKKYDEFNRMARGIALNQLSLAMARKAAEFDIPCYRLDGGGDTIQLGQGKWRRQVFETIIEPQGYLGVVTSTDKQRTIRRWTELGLPVMPSAQVRSETEAAATAEKLGWPVVVKPVRGGKGRGVSVGLATAEDVRAAYRIAAKEGGPVMVERFAEGEDHRLLVVGGRLLAAARRIPAFVTGDGTRDVAALIEAFNADPRRGRPYDKLLEQVVVDERMKRLLTAQGLSLETVPEAGRQVRLSRAANVSQGGSAVDVTAKVHPDNREAVERAAACMGLDIAGVDFISKDISKSWRRAGGALLEINCPPGLRPHWIANPRQDVVSPILRLGFPEGRPARIPTLGVTGTMGKTGTCRMAALMTQAAGLRTATCTTQGMFIDGRPLALGDASGGAPARRMLLDPTVEAGVFELARGALIKKGMAIDGVDVGVVLGVGDIHLGLDGVNTREEMAAVKAIVARNARNWAVLNAEDPLVLPMRERLRPGARLCLAAENPDNPDLAAHRAAGGRTACLRGTGGDEMIVLADGDTVLAEIPVRLIPAAQNGTLRPFVVNALYAAAAGLCLDLPVQAISDGLSGFTSDLHQNPGRHNDIPGFPFELKLHWTDTPPPLKAFVSGLPEDKPAGRRMLYVTQAGNRNDEVIREIGRVAAGHFDAYYCGNVQDLRGRKPEAVPALLAEGLIEGGVAENAIRRLPAGDQSPAAILRDARPGDRVVILTFDTWQTLALIEKARRDASGKAA
jgi:cyanophycin synthetase